MPLHQQECFSALDVDAGTLAITERAAKEAIALPIFPELTEAEQQRVVDALVAYQQQYRLEAA